MLFFLKENKNSYHPFTLKCIYHQVSLGWEENGIRLTSVPPVWDKRLFVRKVAAALSLKEHNQSVISAAHLLLLSLGPLEEWTFCAWVGAIKFLRRAHIGLDHEILTLTLLSVAYLLFQTTKGVYSGGQAAFFFTPFAQ